MEQLQTLERRMLLRDASRSTNRVCGLAGPTRTVDVAG